VGVVKTKKHIENEGQGINGVCDKEASKKGPRRVESGGEDLKRKTHVTPGGGFCDTSRRHRDGEKS